MSESNGLEDDDSHLLPCLPQGWAWTTLEAIADIVGGVTKDKKKDSLPGVREVPYLRVANVQRGFIDLTEIKTIKVSPEDISALALRDGDVLFTEGGDRDKLGRGWIWRGQLPECIHQNHIFRARLLLPGIQPAFVSHHGNFFGRAWFTRAGKQTTNLASINLGILKRFPVPLPPLPEQHRIVEKIEELFSDLDAGVASLERAKANLKRYRASVLKSAVEGRLSEEWRKEHPQTEDALGQIERTPAPPLPNRWPTRSKDIIPGHGALAVGNPETAVPDSWTWTPLVRIARMETGHTPSRKHPEWWGGDVPWISISDARRHDGGMICDTEEHTNSEGLANSASRLLPKGTVCISRTASVGYVVVMGNDMATSQDFVNWVPSACVLSDWLRVVFMADRNALLRFGKGTVHKTIYFPEWLSTHIALPPLAEQEQIVALVEERLSQIDSAEKTIDAELIRSKRLRQSILKRAFEGNLVPQDPKDEPASVLLERIKASRDAEQPKKKAKKVKVRPK